MSNWISAPSGPDMAAGSSSETDMATGSGSETNMSSASSSMTNISTGKKSVVSVSSRSVVGELQSKPSSTSSMVKEKKSIHFPCVPSKGKGILVFNCS